VLDVDAHHPTCRIQINDQTVGHLTGIGARVRIQVNVERICVGIVVEFYSCSWRARGFSASIFAASVTVTMRVIGSTSDSMKPHFS
jgi:hypothetical protein